jgi:hypothetical protein
MRYINIAIELLKQVPAEFWGIVVGSLLALAGVVLSNRANLRNLREQFLHDREVRTKEREHALRKEVYLEVAEAIKTGIECISQHANIDLTHEALVGPYMAKSSSIAKAYVIGGAEVVTTLVTLGGKISTAMLRLAAKRAELFGYKQRIAEREEKMRLADSESSRFLEIMRQRNIEGTADQRVWDVLNQNFEFELVQFREFSGERDALIAEGRPKHLAFINECAAEAHELWRYVIPAMLAIRRELELPIDEETVRNLFEANVEEMAAAIAEYTRILEGGPEPAGQNNAQGQTPA